MLEEAVKCSELQGILTGAYRASIIYEEDRQYLQLELEIRQCVVDNEEIVEQIYRSLIENLGRVQPEFLDDWKNIYSVWDSDPTKRILKLNLLPWPSLSQATETNIKQRGIVK